MMISMVKTLKEKNYSSAFNAVVGLGMLAMFLSTCIPLIMLVDTGALSAPIGFVVGVLIANKKKGWWIALMNTLTSKIERITGN